MHIALLAIMLPVAKGMLQLDDKLDPRAGRDNCLLGAELLGAVAVELRGSL